MKFYDKETGNTLSTENPQVVSMLLSRPDKYVPEEAKAREPSVKKSKAKPEG